MFHIVKTCEDRASVKINMDNFHYQIMEERNREFD